MAEEKFVIDAPDGAKIYGVLNYSGKKKNDKLVIYIHGLTGDVRDYAAVRMALDFPKSGYDVARVNLYWWQEGARSLTDCTFKIHGADINAVVKHYKKKYKNVYGVGFSFGGPSIMESNINQFDAVTLWDPTYIPAKSIGRKDYIKHKNLYLSLTGSTYIMGQDFMDACAAFTRDYSVSLAKKCKTPLKVIYGDNNSFWIGEGESFHTHAKGPTDEHAIKTSQHCFYEEGSTAPLLRHTRQWFDNF